MSSQGDHGAPEPKREKSSSHRPLAAILDEVGQTPPVRQKLIREVESYFPGFSVLTYFTSFDEENAMIADSDAEMIEELLVARDGLKPIMLVIDSPGGDGMAAERVVNVCRRYSNNQFEVIVPHMAKSAATMICFGANAVHMSTTAELGPVDPQVLQYGDSGGRLWISADELLRAYDTLLEAAATDPKVIRVDPYLQQLQRFDARRIEQIRSARKLSEDISVKLLQLKQMQGVQDEQIKEKIRMFLQQAHRVHHGRRVGVEEAREAGLSVKELDLNGAAWKAIWALYRRSSFYVSRMDEASKLMETATEAVYA